MIGVQTDGVTMVLNHDGHITVYFGIFPNQKKGGWSLKIIQDPQDFFGVHWVWTIIKGQENPVSIGEPENKTVEGNCLNKLFL